MGPIDERPFAQWLNEAVGNHELGGGGLGGIESGSFEHFSEAELVPSGHGDALGAELDDVFGLDLIEEHTVNLVDRGGFGALGAAQKLEDARHPGGGLIGERRIDGELGFS